MLKKQDHTIIRDTGSEWGELILSNHHRPSGRGVRIVLFGSTTAGHLVLDTLLRFNRMHPGEIDIRAVATDDTRDPRARIGIKKRIWKYYSKEYQGMLMDLVTCKASSNGIPCYTGGVKNEYFRGLLRSWDPQLIIMCCFGQKVDRFIYEYPAYGMYNFHPSDLASNIGAGAKPFESTMIEGRTTSHMILHTVTDIIDGGPIVGISPPINISMANGKYPKSFLVLQEKIPSISGWMTFGLLSDILEKKKQGESGPVSKIDFDGIIPEGIRTLLMKPVNNNPLKTDKLPYPEHETPE